LVFFVVLWNIFTRFGVLCQEKSDNPGSSWEVAKFEI
jgi:hypothetical protein